MKLAFVLLVVMNTSCFAMECLICLDPLNQGNHLRLGCSHAYHQPCWNEWTFSENTRIALFASIPKDEDQPVSEQKIPGIGCPACKTIVNFSQTIFWQKQRNSFLKKLRMKCGKLFRKERRETIPSSEAHESTDS